MSQKKGQQTVPQNTQPIQQQPPFQDKEYLLEDQREARLLEELAEQKEPQIYDKALPTKHYLEKTVITQIYEAMQVLCKQRPADPIQFFAYYLLTIKERKQNQFREEQKKKNEQQFVQEKA